MKTSTLFYISLGIFLLGFGFFLLIINCVDPAGAEVTAEVPIVPEVPVEKYGKPLDYTQSAGAQIADIPEIKYCKAGILVDMNTRKVLWDKQAQKSVPIASMTKMMTALIVMDELEKNPEVNMNTMISVTDTAIKIKEGTVWLDRRESFSVEKLLQAAVIKSANDCAFLLAESFGKGNLEPFIQKMNQKTDVLKMKQTQFFNPHGLPGKSESLDNRASPEDLVFLAEAFMDNEVLMKYAATQRETLPSPRRKVPTELLSTNRRLLQGLPGCDGLKTGFTQRAGFCLAASCQRDGRRLVCIVTGLDTSTNRFSLVKKLMEYGFKK